MKTFKIGPKTRAELEHKLDVARDTLAELEKREADPALTRELREALKRAIGIEAANG